jgi:thiazole synthase ThiGH ThiG subunit
MEHHRIAAMSDDQLPVAMAMEEAMRHRVEAGDGAGTAGVMHRPGDLRPKICVHYRNARLADARS